MASLLRAYKYVHNPQCSGLGLTSLYSAALIRRPLITQCATAAVLFGTGDVIAQQLVEKKGDKHDVGVCARVFSHSINLVVLV